MACEASANPLRWPETLASWLGFGECDALFPSFSFILAFLPLAVGLYWLLPTGRPRLLWMTFASLGFYALWDVRFVPLLLFAAAIDFVIAQKIAASDEARRRKNWLIASLAINLGVLGFFKYFMWGAENVVGLLNYMGVEGAAPGWNIVLPVGISFYTFQTLSYTIDVYRRDLEATNDLAKYTAYVTLFPQLVAGPIVRFSTVNDQLDNIPRRADKTLFQFGIWLFIIGLAKKLVVADSIATGVGRLWPGIEPLWAQPGNMDAIAAWTASVGYTLQLYFDFSGYSDMAIGLGAMLGLRFPINFNAPYHALNPSEFWRRWHISLSTFLRDYLYIPLGGNRVSATRIYGNLMVTMLLGGLWHGAAWTFVAWGAFHGALLAAYRWKRGAWDKVPVLIRHPLMMVLVIFGWVLFRSPDLSTAGTVFSAMFGPISGGAVEMAYLAALVALLIGTMTVRSWPELPRILTARRVVWAGIALAFSIVAMRSGQSPFLYYQF